MAHPIHLHRQRFEITNMGGKATLGIVKEVIMPGGYHEMDFDFKAGNPGLSLPHCPMRLQRNFGFMALFACAWDQTDGSLNHIIC